MLSVCCMLVSSKQVPQFTDAIVQLLLDEHSVSILFALTVFTGFSLFVFLFRNIDVLHYKTFVR